MKKREGFVKAEECSAKKALSNQLTANQSRDMKHKLVTSYSQKSVDNHIIYLPAKNCQPRP